MFFHELNQDVLAVIVSYLSPSRQDVINLALSHQAFYQVAKYPEHIQISCPSTHFVALTNNFIADPSYGHKVQSLDFCINGTKDSISRAKIRAFLDRMPNVRDLRMDANVKPHYAKLLVKRELEMCKTIRKLCVHDVTLSLQDWVSLLTLPNLRHISFPMPPKIYYNPSAQPPQSPLPNLKSLHLGLSGKSFAFPTSIMRQILPLTTSLSSIEWNMTLAGPTKHDYTCPWCPHLLYSISSEYTLNTLSCLSTTLVNLKLFSNGNIKISLDNSRLDLTSFVNLKTIQAGAEFWFQPLRRNVARDGFYSFLPQGLETLTLIFPWEICLFYNHDTHDVRFDVAGRQAFVNGTMELSLYRWIEEIAEMKQSCFPGLKEMVIREQTTRKGEGSRSERWVANEGVRETFEDTGTKLEVCVRVAKAWNVPHPPPSPPPPPSAPVPRMRMRMRKLFSLLGT